MSQSMADFINLRLITQQIKDRFGIHKLVDELNIFEIL